LPGTGRARQAAPPVCHLPHSLNCPGRDRRSADDCQQPVSGSHPPVTAHIHPFGALRAAIRTRPAWRHIGGDARLIHV